MRRAADITKGPSRLLAALWAARRHALDFVEHDFSFSEAAYRAKRFLLGDGERLPTWDVQPSSSVDGALPVQAPARTPSGELAVLPRASAGPIPLDARQVRRNRHRRNKQLRKAREAQEAVDTVVGAPSEEEEAEA